MAQILLVRFVVDLLPKNDLPNVESRSPLLLGMDIER